MRRAIAAAAAAAAQAASGESCCGGRRAAATAATVAHRSARARHEDGDREGQREHDALSEVGDAERRHLLPVQLGRAVAVQRLLARRLLPLPLRRRAAGAGAAVGVVAAAAAVAVCGAAGACAAAAAATAATALLGGRVGRHPALLRRAHTGG